MLVGTDGNSKVVCAGEILVVVLFPDSAVLIDALNKPPLADDLNKPILAYFGGCLPLNLVSSTPFGNTPTSSNKLCSQTPRSHTRLVDFTINTHETPIPQFTLFASGFHEALLPTLFHHKLLYPFLEHPLPFFSSVFLSLSFSLSRSLSLSVCLSLSLARFRARARARSLSLSRARSLSL
jgi:hypothetical protein